MPPPTQPSAPGDAWIRLSPLVFVVLWSTGFLGAKFGLPYAEPLTFLLVRFACVSTLLLALALVLRSPWPADWPSVRRIAVVGLLIHGLYLGGVFVAIKSGLSAGLAALIVGLQPLATAFIAAPLLGERLVPRQWLGLILGFGGVVLVVSGKFGLGQISWPGIAACLVALAGMTAGTLYQKRHGGGMNLITGSFVQFVAAGLAYLPVVAVFETFHVEWTGSFLFALSWLTLVLSIGAITLLHLMIRRGAASKVASLFYLTPAVTAVLAWLLFGETLSWPAIAGMAVASAGVALVARA
jgi:drug/metabolite transporter (DMT)-like permease